MSEDFEYKEVTDEAPVWQRPGTGKPSPFEAAEAENPFSGNGFAGDDQPVQDVNFEETDEPEAPYEPVQPVHYNSQSGTGSDQQFYRADGSNNTVTMHEYAYYFSKGKSDREPSVRLVNMTATGNGFNFPAFLFGVFYFIYRKMYIEAVGVFFVSIAVNMIIRESVPALVLTLIFSMLFGFFFAKFYRNKLEKKVTEAMARNVDVRATLIEAGGVNIIGTVICVVGYFIMYALTFGV